MTDKLTVEQKRLVESCINMAYGLANKYSAKNPTMCSEDIEQEAMMGLIEAATRFDIGRGVKFTTYSYPWIMKFILKYIESNLSRGMKPEKKVVQDFLYGKMCDDDSERFIDVFILTLGIDVDFSRVESDGHLVEVIGECDRYPGIEGDYVQWVATTADTLLVGTHKAVFLEVITWIIWGVDDPIEAAAESMCLDAHTVEGIFDESAGTIRDASND